MDKLISQDQQARREWVEPDVSELTVSETSVFPARGGDGGRFVDCTRS